MDKLTATAAEDKNDDYDSPWKDIIEERFRDFMEFFFPGAAAELDWERDYEFLDKEFQKIVRDSEVGKRYADKLIKLWRKNGEEAWILIHVEVQGGVEKDFAKRMYTYHYRIFDRYDRQPVSMAVLTDDNSAWRPGEYSYSLWGCSLDLRFPAVKLLDLAKNAEELEKSENPFAVVTMAHLKTMETRNDPENRKRWKLRLLKRLYARGYTKREIINLFKFIDWVMRLPDELEDEFWREFTKYEEETKMPYVTSVEKIGIKKGMQLGLEQGMQQGVQQGMQQGTVQTIKEDVLHILKLRFGDVPMTVARGISGMDDASVLKNMLSKAVTEASLEDFMLSADIAPQFQA